MTETYVANAMRAKWGSIYGRILANTQRRQAWDRYHKRYNDDRPLDLLTAAARASFWVAVSDRLAREESAPVRPS